MADAFGAKIKELRKQAGITGRELARRVGTAQSYVSKIERGLLRPKEDFCRRAAEALSLAQSEADELINLLALYRADHHPISASINAIEDRQEAVRKLEEVSKLISLYQPILVPGLLQTRRYMTAVLSRYSADPKEVDSAVQKREERQNILRDRQRQFRFVIDEMALHRRIAAPEVLEEQTEALLRNSATHQNVQIRYLPMDATIPTDMKLPIAGFEIIDESTVITETLPGLINTYIHPDEVAEYVRAFTRLFEIGDRRMPLIQFDQVSF